MAQSWTKYRLGVASVLVATLIVVGCATQVKKTDRVDKTEWENLSKEVGELYRSGQYDLAVIVGTRAVEVAEKNVGPNHPDVAQSLNDLAVLYSTQGQYAQAEPLYKRALAIREQALGPNDPLVAQSLKDLAALFRATKRSKEAGTLEQRAARIRAIQR
jgi:tetratricopeptide (TPR) repeat protein